ncbi:ABC transporter substrate-binding protein [Oligoflexus tunisiensis]|uniref:ABC transporter substrate-binding protein n=1 Tax=Oligoflexus tunisiensis TaxID=708132 RepID=UPI00159F2191|nr:ABC transporter substrate-binding protein [Oligoflexus tunisiensis]
MRRTIFRSGLLLLILLFGKVLVSSLDAAPTRHKPIHVTLLIDKLDEFWIHFVRLTQVAAAQLGMRVDVFHGHESHLDMIRKAKELAAKPDKPDVIMFKSFKGNGKQIMQIAAQHQIKTFAVNAPIFLPPHQRPDSPTLIGSLLPDDEQAGYALVQSMRAEMKKRKIETLHMVAINGDQADSPARLRERGLRRAVAEFKDIKLHQLISDAWTAPHAAQQFEILRKRYPMINAVWAGNDTIALRVAEQAKRSGYQLGRNLFIGGIDISPEGLMAVKQGDLITTVGGHILDGARALVILHDYFKLGQLPQKTWLTPMEAVTRAEVDAYFKVLNPQLKNPVDFTRYTRWQDPQKGYDFTFPKS